MEPEECERAGQIVVAAYRALPGHVEEPDYERELADVASRADSVFVAVDEGGAVVGCVTFVAGTDSAHAEFDDPAAAGFRMLGVDPERQGSGAGKALVARCVERARAAGQGADHHPLDAVDDARPCHVRPVRVRATPRSRLGARARHRALGVRAGARRYAGSRPG